MTERVPAYKNLTQQFRHERDRPHLTSPASPGVARRHIETESRCSNATQIQFNQVNMQVMFFSRYLCAVFQKREREG